MVTDATRERPERHDDMSVPPADPDGRANRVLVAIVAPFYIAWVAVGAGVSAVGKALHAASSALWAGVLVLLRPVRGFLRLIAQGIPASNREFGGWSRPLRVRPVDSRRPSATASPRP